MYKLLKLRRTAMPSLPTNRRDADAGITDSRCDVDEAARRVRGGATCTF